MWILFGAQYCDHDAAFIVAIIFIGFIIRHNEKPNLMSAMTPFPYSVTLDTLFSDARKLMKEHGMHGELVVKRFLDQFLEEN